jgi:hypothetical protein
VTLTALFADLLLTTLQSRIVLCLPNRDRAEANRRDR